MLNRLSILFIIYISRDLENKKILLYTLFVRYLIVKPACVNAALDNLAVQHWIQISSATDVEFYAEIVLYKFYTNLLL